MSDDYSWDEDWPRVTVEYAREDRYFFQMSADEPREEISKREHERALATWVAQREAGARDREGELLLGVLSRVLGGDVTAAREGCEPQVGVGENSLLLDCRVEVSDEEVEVLARRMLRPGP